MQPNRLGLAVWAASVAACAAVAQLPGDPGPVPVPWLVALAVLGLLAHRGSTAAHAALVVLNAALLLTSLLLATPVGAALWAFYGLAATGLVGLVGAPLVAARLTPRPAARGSAG
ncbi:hypothetical protein [Blastococcus sp. TF02A-35]|uniref:hypothetical protein n=1 Tax=Blastococcus sp. TF02A-35 TaxID=2559612 RepID=UPI0010731C62|nr:hypothetical protein [Blastococcus sp. TF02A_35]TFV53780.1 hypothetical protein E4P43_00575 [Blastococcus sp. TF02A_35]